MKTNKNQINCKIITAFSIAIVITCTVQSLTAQPVINSFSPTAGVIGTTVTIKGKNFNPEAEKNTVYFGAVKAAVSNVTDSSLNVVVPIGATYQPITITADSLTATSKYPFLVTFSGGNTTFSPGSFSNELVLSGTSCSYEIALADLDGDNKPDIAYSNDCNNGLSISKNTTLGSAISFKPAVDIKTGLNPIGLAVYDLDGDGKKDIVTADFNLYEDTAGDLISVFKNTSTPGAISFAPKKDYRAGMGCYGIAIADLNNDGKPDLIATNEYDNPGTVSVYVNTSTKDSLYFC